MWRSISSSSVHARNKPDWASKIHLVSSPAITTTTCWIVCSLGAQTLAHAGNLPPYQCKWRDPVIRGTSGYRRLFIAKVFYPGARYVG